MDLRLANALHAQNSLSNSKQINSKEEPLKVLMAESQKVPYEADIGNKLQGLQSAVGGLIARCNIDCVNSEPR